MSNVRRVYVEKKPDFAVKAKELKHEIKHYLGITTVEAVRVLIRYDVENISEETYKKALYTVFSEPPVDDIYEETFDYGDAVLLNSSKLLICNSTLNHICDSTSDNRLLILIEKLHALLG